MSTPRNLFIQIKNKTSLIKVALKGNKTMLKICLEYILPSTTNTAAGKLKLPQGGISLEKMPELAASLLSQVSEGTIDAKAAKELAEVGGGILIANISLNIAKGKHAFNKFKRDHELAYIIEAKKRLEVSS